MKTLRQQQRLYNKQIKRTHNNKQTTPTNYFVLKEKLKQN